MPKSNMYQSLHTKVRGPGGRLLEIQIRTWQMHHIAEEGIAAHWAYKEQTGWDDKLQDKVSWVRQALDWESDSSTPKEFMETLRDDLFSDEVFAFTPRGKLIVLPRGATPIDFAFAVHTDVGYQCIGAKVNNKIVPLNAELQSGDSVEIITSAKQKPSQDWLRYVVSAKAKSKIKRWLRESQYQQSIKLGQELLSRELNRLHVKLTNDQAEEFSREMEYETVEAFYAALGSGDVQVQTVLNRLDTKKLLHTREDGPIQRVIRKVRRSDGGIKIQGMDDLLISFADCCRPLPGDKIIGFITTGKGISVHRIDCKNARWLMSETDRDVAVEWDVEKDQEFNARVQLLGEDRRHLLRDITQAIAPLDVNMIELDMKSEGTVALGAMVVQVKNLSHLTRLIRKIQDVKGVISVSRLDAEVAQNNEPPVADSDDIDEGESEDEPDSQ
jgi:GTP pyrophosphokinase